MAERQELEIAHDDATGETLVGYADPALDDVTGLRLAHGTGMLSAERPRRFSADCGTVSVAMASKLRGVAKVMWSRIFEGRTVAVSEIPLKHS